MRVSLPVLAAAFCVATCAGCDRTKPTDRPAAVQIVQHTKAPPATNPTAVPQDDVCGTYSVGALPATVSIVHHADGTSVKRTYVVSASNVDKTKVDYQFVSVEGDPAANRAAVQAAMIELHTKLTT